MNPQLYPVIVLHLLLVATGTWWYGMRFLGGLTALNLVSALLEWKWTPRHLRDRELLLALVVLTLVPGLHLLLHSTCRST